MNNLIEKYVPNYAKELVADIHHDIDGYDIMLVDGYYFEDTYTTMRIEPTVAELKKVFKFIKEMDEVDMKAFGIEPAKEEEVDQVEEVQEVTEYVYEMTARPVSIGTQPKGFTWFDESKGNWGIVAYDRELTEKELQEYEMREW